MIKAVFRPRDSGSFMLATAQLDFKESLDLDVPMSYGVGLAARLSDTLTLSLDVSRVRWSVLNWRSRRKTTLSWSKMGRREARARSPPGQCRRYHERAPRGGIPMDSTVYQHIFFASLSYHF